MDPFDQFIELAGWPKDLDLIGRERLLSLWIFSCQPTTELRASVFKKLTSVLSGQEAQGWEEKEWMDVVLAVCNGSADEKEQLADVMCRRYLSRRKQVLKRLMAPLKLCKTETNDVDAQANRAPAEPAIADSVTGNPVSAAPHLRSQTGAGSDKATEAAPATATGGEVRFGVGAVSTDHLLIETHGSDSDEPRPSTSRQAAARNVQLNNSSSKLTAARSVSCNNSGNKKRKKTVPETGGSADPQDKRSPNLGPGTEAATVDSVTSNRISTTPDRPKGLQSGAENDNGPLKAMDPFNQFIELAGWPKTLNLIGRQRLLSLWTYSSCQPATELRASVFDKLTTVLSTQEAQGWDEKEWMEVAQAGRRGSVDEKDRLTEAMWSRFKKPQPEVLGPLMTALYTSETETNKSSADHQVMRSTNLASEPAADSVTSPASVTPNRPKDPQSGNGNSGFCGPTPDSTVTATAGGGAVSTAEVIDISSNTDSDSDEPRLSTRPRRKAAAFTPARARRSVSSNSNNKRKISDADAHVSGRNTKSPRPELKQYSGVVHLSVSDIQGTTRLEDGCIQVDPEKWEAIMKGCQPSAKLILPEGSFSFPPKYDLRPSQSGVTISGTSPEKTTICYHPPSGMPNQPKKPKKLTTAVILILWNELTLENLSVKAKFPQENFWSRVMIFGDSCQVQNVTFHGCGLGIESKKNVVENLKFFGQVENPAVSRLPTSESPDGIYIWTPGSSGNIVKNIDIQDLYYGVWKVNTEPRAKPKLGMTDLIENVTCRNVKFGVNFRMCRGAVVKNLTWQWDWSIQEEVRTEIPAAVQIHGGQGNEVSEITCQGKGKYFYGFVLYDKDESGVPKKNKISSVKGASGKYWDNGEENELSDVDGLMQ